MEHPPKEAETSFKPLTVSSKPCAVSTTTEQEQPLLKIYAAERARLLFGAFRKGEANDPEIYVAAITAMLATYPRDVIRTVTHPTKGIAAKLKFLPAVAEIREACEELMVSRREQEARQKRIEQQLAERAEFEKRNPVYAKDSPEAKAVKVLHDIVGRTSAYWQIFRRSDGSVTYTKLMTEQLTALSQAPDQSEWVMLTHQQAGAWESLLGKVFDKGLVRVRLHEGSKAPWPWPPSIDGKLYTQADGVPPMTTEDLDALANEGQK